MKGRGEALGLIGELYERFGRELFAFGCRLGGRDPELAGDLVQETFLRALTHQEDLEKLTDPQRRGWLYKTAKNLFLDKVRRASAEQQKLNFLPAEEIDDRAFDEAEAEQLLLLLPPDMRLLFRMRYVEGYNASELGEMLNLPSGTVRARLSAARKILKSKLLEG